MECATDGNLQNYLEKHTLTWYDKTNLAFQLASAVLCLHEEGIIHCDLVIYNLILYIIHLLYNIN
jgi:serine/threonine protein kinase